MILLVLFLVLGAWPWPEAYAQSISVRWFRFDPVVVRSDRTEPVVFKAQFDGNPSRVQLELAAGSTVPLSPEGGGVWSVTLTSPEVLFGYQSANANHNFVGFLDVFQGATRVVRSNNFISVLDENVPDVTSDIQNVGNTFRVTRHVANLWLPGRTPGLPSGAEIQSISQQFYQIYSDEYDFLNLVFVLPSSNNNRFHITVKNEVDGIGLSRRDGTATYGSNGRLQGLNIFPIDSFFDMADPGALHEIGHQWINFSTLPILQSGVPHWPISSLARGIMGLSIPLSNVGGEFPFNLIPLPNGDYQLQQTTPLREFTDLDLYLMGLLPVDQVGTHIVFQNQNQTQLLCNGCILAGPVTTVTIDDVIGAQGPRSPDATTSQKTFRVATIIVTKDRFLNNDELALFDYFAARGEAIVPLPWSLGFGIGTTKPFYLATRGLGSLNTQLTLPPQPGPGTLQFSSSNYSANEGAGNATITITRTGGSNGAVGVTFAASNGTAQAGSDYVSVNQQVFFADGDMASKTVNIPITNDSTLEGSETVNLALSNATGGATLGSPSTAVLTIVDDDVVAPDTILDPGPAADGGATNSTTAVFNFTSTVPSSTFACSLDAAAFAACKSPKTYTRLKAGSHNFKVQAIAGGVSDPTPASFGWTIDNIAPNTTITVFPALLTQNPIATFEFISTEVGGGFQCSLDRSPFAPCASPFVSGVLADGKHNFQVKAVDAVGNVDRSAAKAKAWTVDATPPVTTITGKPTSPTTITSATFRFKSEIKSTFVCKLDDGAFEACKSGKKYSGLLPGPHTFQVQATDAATNVELTPFSYNWTQN